MSIYIKSIFYYLSRKEPGIRHGVSSLVGMAIIVAISVIIGMGLYMYTHNIFSISTPRDSPIEMTLTCYNISVSVNESGYICFAYNSLGYNISLGIYLENGSIINYSFSPYSLNVIGCSKTNSTIDWFMCNPIKSRIIYVECISCEKSVRMKVLYKDFRSVIVG
ncbi:hypothetical protein Igag_1883 [Ignisphaera aggregans DSM 17230]|uniref:Type IV pilin n=1 Tax=Ignisphaera aggregans (strain DSM 17230 / JCM 13409 / AQ1.S1) TaxID=583356 RepID=E0ST16_IGNAA|nr:hypothetical protein Igag_1883 [Ignisphaera aggregans DSM 17230]